MEEGKGEAAEKRSVGSATSGDGVSWRRGSELERKGSQREVASTPTTHKERRVNFAEAVREKSTLEKRDSLKEIGNRGDVVQRRFVSTWRLACDKTRDRTKELLKRWRPSSHDELGTPRSEEAASHNWTVHVWTTWVKRYPSEEEIVPEEHNADNLTAVQKEKLSHFFSHVFDIDRDDMISLQDFESFTERLRHFADWTLNSGEYLVLQQVQQGFVEALLLNTRPEPLENTSFDLYKEMLSLEDWLWQWSRILDGVKNVQDFPIWLQYFIKVLFQAINKSGSGRISKEELSAFYSSVMGFTQNQLEKILDEAYNAMTANGDCRLSYSVYRLIFANFLLGRFPNGPGQWVFGCVIQRPDSFPVDYTAMNTAPEDIEVFTPDKKSNRRSVVV